MMKATLNATNDDDANTLPVLNPHEIPRPLVIVEPLL
jgi:hypothetical protein